MKRRQYSFSRAALSQVVDKIRFEPGDVLVVRDFEVLQAIEAGYVKVKLNFNVPLVYAPHGVKVLKREDILNLLEQLDSVHTPATQPIGEVTSTPL